MHNKSFTPTITSGDTTATNAGSYKITVSLDPNHEWIDGTSTPVILNWNIAKAEPVYALPNDLSGALDEPLSTVDLPNGWSWQDETIIMTPTGDNTYNIIYTPSDTTNYKTVNTSTTVTVIEAVRYDVMTSVAGEGGSISTSETGIIEGSLVVVKFMPNAGHVISKVLLNGIDVSDQVINNQMTIDSLDSNLNIIVTYKIAAIKIIIPKSEGLPEGSSGTVDLDYDSNYEIDLNLETGYKLFSIKINGRDRTADVVDGKLLLTNLTSDITVVLDIRKVSVLNPRTGDNIYFYIILAIISLIPMLGSIKYTFRKN